MKTTETPAPLPAESGATVSKVDRPPAALHGMRGVPGVSAEAGRAGFGPFRLTPSS